MTVEVWVDFNMLSGGVVETLAAFAAPSVDLTPGRIVLVGDDDGTVAKARIEAVKDGLVTLRVDPASYVSETAQAAAGVR